MLAVIAAAATFLTGIDVTGLQTVFANGTSGYKIEVSYSEAQAGDIIYYGGHVAIYLGGGRIVHASTEKTGIKTSSATYRAIRSVRR